MPQTPDLVDEPNTPMRFDRATSPQGVKAHKAADPAVIAAARRLHAKGFLTQLDGGFRPLSGAPRRSAPGRCRAY